MPEGTRRHLPYDGYQKKVRFSVLLHEESEKVRFVILLYEGYQKLHFDIGFG